MDNLSLSDLYTMRDEINYQIIEAEPKEAKKLYRKLEDIETWIMVKEVETKGD